jgi:hypothetical protein
MSIRDLFPANVLCEKEIVVAGDHDLMAVGQFAQPQIEVCEHCWLS